MGIENNRKHRYQALLLLLLLVLVVAVSILVPWWLKMDFYQERIAALTERHQRYANLVTRKPLLQRELKALKKQFKVSQYYIDASTPQLAAAQLQQRVKQVITRAGGKLVSTQNLPRPEKDGDKKVAVRVRMNGDTDVLVKVLHDLEAGKPLLFVENLSIRSRKRVEGRRKKRKTIYSNDLHFDLIGYQRGAIQ